MVDNHDDDVEASTADPGGIHWLRWLGTSFLVAAAVGILAIYVVQGRTQDVFLGGDYPAVQKRIPLHAISHTLWDELLNQYVDANGLVDYQGLHTKENITKLEQYLAQLSTGDPDQTTMTEAAMAFWINAYNAVTIRGILREYPTDSIRNHTSLVGYNIWKNLKLRVGGGAYSLEQMEHAVLRKMGDPRIHFAIVCASKGCPRLLNEAYVPQRLDEQLKANAHDFFGRNQNFHWDVQQREFQVSSILKWFANDFGKDPASRLKTIKPWLPEAAQAMIDNGDVTITYLPYSWELNSQSGNP